MAIAQVTIVPIGTGSTSLSGYVAELHRILEQERSSVRYELTPMSTIIEGDWEDILRVVRQMHESPFLQGAQRVSTTITIDDRRDKAASMKQKLESVEQKLHTRR
ncbi:MTH1187 family thiamine-binding protein [Cohnella sp. CFH 77786]|uniref:MTH1187 family thiamine-binding protein n=1 Tax=Cohnella sp. CFH 77786 TaxID=2662265 RepID=UPI001C60B5D3|nr:MTH1187 family thiamine-binding protein [Cohnella sp. CFH 77786]MBW5448053.1 MTH1187 family thiamine-binding protein [Cohnella sp. CFH 77786]